MDFIKFFHKIRNHLNLKVLNNIILNIYQWILEILLFIFSNMIILLLQYKQDN